MDIYKLNNKELKEVSKEFDKTAYGSKCKLFIFLPLVMIFFLIFVMLVGLLVLCVKASIYRNKLSYFYYIAIMILATLVADVFIRNQIYFEDHVERANNDYVNVTLLIKAKLLLFDFISFKAWPLTHIYP